MQTAPNLSLFNDDFRIHMHCIPRVFSVSLSNTNYCEIVSSWRVSFLSFQLCFFSWMWRTNTYASIFSNKKEMWLLTRPPHGSVYSQMVYCKNRRLSLEKKRSAHTHNSFLLTQFHDQNLKIVSYFVIKNSSISSFHYIDMAHNKFQLKIFVYLLLLS